MPVCVANQKNLFATQTGIKYRSITAFAVAVFTEHSPTYRAITKRVYSTQFGHIDNLPNTARHTVMFLSVLTVFTDPDTLQNEACLFFAQ